MAATATSLPALPNRLSTPAALQALRYGLDPEGFFASAHRRHGDTFTVQILSETWTVMADPSAVKEVFSHGPEEMNSGEANALLRPLIGVRNVLLLDGEEHIRRRRLVLPPFHGERMRAYESMIRDAAAEMASTWPLEEPVAAFPRLQALTFGVILSGVFGLSDVDRLDSLASSLRQMLSWIMSMRRAIFLGFAGPERLMALRGFREQVEAVDCAIYAEIETRRGVGDLAKREDILSLLLQARDEDDVGLCDEELRDELLTLLVAGHETTATLLAWVLHEVSRDPESQECLARHPEDFCDPVITETLRLRPPLPVVLRRLREPLTIAGEHLPAGATVAPCTLLVHRRPDLYPEPWAFRPERFFDRPPIPSEWFPFGGAVRRCIGAAFARFEARIVLEELMRELCFSAVRLQPERTARRGPVLVPGRGACVVATKRRHGQRLGSSLRSAASGTTLRDPVTRIV